MSSDCSPPQPRNHKHGRPIIIGLGYILRVHCASSKTIRGRSRKVRSLSRNEGERERERGILSFLLRLQIRSISHGLSLSLVSPFQRDKNSFPPRLRVSPLRYLSHFPLERFTAILGVSVCLGWTLATSVSKRVECGLIHDQAVPSLVYVTWWRFWWGQRDINVGLGKECRSHHIEFSSQQFF